MSQFTAWVAAVINFLLLIGMIAKPDAMVVVAFEIYGIPITLMAMIFAVFRKPLSGRQLKLGLLFPLAISWAAPILAYGYFRFRF